MNLPFFDAAIPRSRREIFAYAAALLAARSALRGQDEDPVFTADVKVVNVLAVVHGKSGEIIGDLTKADFSLREDKRPQAIRYFSKQSDLPLTIGLMVDTSMSQERVLDAERGASYRFLDRVLRETKDRCFILQFDMSVRLKQGLTASRKLLDDALDFVDTPTRSQLRMAGSSGGTLLYDAVVQASNATMKDIRGRKAVIILTDGVDFGSEATLSAAVDAAQKADTLVYAILFSDPRAYGFSGGPDGKSVLMRMSKDTGGGFFAVSKKLTLEQIFDRIQEELRTQYSLGYVSDQPVSISEFRRIQVELSRKGLIVQARERYWARP